MRKSILISLILILLVFAGCEKAQKPEVIVVEPEETAQESVNETQNTADISDTETELEDEKEETEEDVAVCEGDCDTVDITLDDYPSPFLKGNKLNTYVIVGAQATSLEVVAATELLAGVEFDSRAGDYAPDTLDTDLNSIAGKNAILIGNPCNNKFIAKLMPYVNDCLEDFNSGEAIIKLFKTGDNTYALVVGGYSGQDTRRAAQYMGNYKSKTLGRTEMKV